MDKEIIVSLIAEDIKHNQLLKGLNELGLTTNENHELNLVGIISKLMSNKEDEWFEFYHSKMQSFSIHLSTKERTSEAQCMFESLCALVVEKV
jgi:hypothetical protein